MSGNHHDRHQTGTESYAALRTKALESLLVEKGLITTDVIDTVVRAYEQDIGPLNGARVVARAWVDPAYNSVSWRMAHRPLPNSASGAARG
jgi:nitrile hydratase subunit alpha